MDICIIGAVFAGLIAANVLSTFGHRVTVFEKEADVGGVWSASRRYPGLTTQNVRSTYAFSDYPYPNDYPEWPSGEQVQRYLASYTREFGLENKVKLNSEVITAKQIEGDLGWNVEVKRRSPSGDSAEVVRYKFDYLIVCNGIFSQPLIPEYAGAADFVASGGRICHTSEFKALEDAKGKHVLVVGYGKSSCDVAQAVSGIALSTTVTARNLIWKVPKMLMNVLNYKYLLLTRLG